MGILVWRAIGAATFAAAAGCATGATDDGVAGASSDGGDTPAVGDDASKPAVDAAAPPKGSKDGGGAKDTGAPPPSHDASNPPPPPDDSGADPDTGGGACTLPAAAASGIPACDQCEQTNCCAKIAACLDNPPCLAIYNCTQNCDNGISGDGGTFDSTNASLVDACWNACEAGQITASTFETQDNCVSTSCTTPCML
jgi:hypothetical protein